MKRFLYYVYQFLIVLGVLALIAVVKLSQHADVHGYDTFSMRNIKETSLLLVICAAAIIPIIYVIEKITGKKVLSPGGYVKKFFSSLSDKK
jgi:hypothetical protein